MSYGIPKRHCDKCGKLINSINDETNISFKITELNNITYTEYTLCTTCAKKLMNWIETKERNNHGEY